MLSVIVSKSNSIRDSCRQTADNTQQLIALYSTYCRKMSDIVIYYIDHMDTGCGAEISEEEINGPGKRGSPIEDCEMNNKQEQSYGNCSPFFYEKLFHLRIFH